LIILSSTGGGRNYRFLLPWRLDFPFFFHLCLLPWRPQSRPFFAPRRGKKKKTDSHSNFPFMSFIRPPFLVLMGGHRTRSCHGSSVIPRVLSAGSVHARRRRNFLHNIAHKRRTEITVTTRFKENFPVSNGNYAPPLYYRGGANIRVPNKSQGLISKI
jgi:hypothetical protein